MCRDIVGLAVLLFDVTASSVGNVTNGGPEEEGIEEVEEEVKSYEINSCLGLRCRCCCCCGRSLPRGPENSLFRSRS